MRKYFTALIAFTIITMSFGLLVSAKEGAAQTNKTPALDDTSFEKIIKLSDPSDMQVLLSGLRGEWNYSVITRTAPNAKPEESTGTTLNEMILGDRFISMKSFGILNISGHYLPFEVNGLMGYDNIKKIFTSVWVDTLNPGMMIGNGTYIEKNNLIKENGDFTSSVSKISQKYRSELEFTDSESYKRTIFSVDKSGKEYKIMEFVYSKKK